MSEKLFNVGVKAIIVKDSKCLIVKNIKGFWEVPGGRISGNESIEQALHRELREELPNIHSIALNKIVDAQRVHKDIKDDVSLFLVFYSVDADFDGEPELSEEHTAYKWATTKEALETVFDKYRDAIRNTLATNTDN